jgi:hypothetical protein
VDLIKYIPTYSQFYKYYIVGYLNKTFNIAHDSLLEIPADHLKKPGHPLVELAEGQLNRLDRIYQESVTHTSTCHSVADIVRMIPDSTFQTSNRFRNS